MRTEVRCRALDALLPDKFGARLRTVRARAVARMKHFYAVPDAQPDLTLMSGMRVGDTHPLHADAEQRTPQGWGPNHTSWRTHVGLLYLNTSGVDYEGGLLRLPALGRTISPVAGMFVAFPSDRAHEHEVTRIDTGERLSLAVWLTGDPAHAERWPRDARSQPLARSSRSRYARINRSRNRRVPAKTRPFTRSSGCQAPCAAGALALGGSNV